MLGMEPPQIKATPVHIEMFVFTFILFIALIIEGFFVNYLICDADFFGPQIA